MSDPGPMLSPKQIAAALGVSESSVKRWADAGQLKVTRTPGGHRRISLPEAVRFVREGHFSLVRPDVIGLPALAAKTGEDDAQGDVGAMLYDRLLAGDAEVIPAWAVSAYLAGTSIAEICDTGLRAALQRIGHVWVDEPRGIFLEHRATDQTVAALHTLLQLLTDANAQEKADRRPVALGGAPSNDPYLIPSLMAMCVLTDAGYRAMNLGPDVPIASLLDAARFFDARLVWVSISSTKAKPPPLETLNELAEELGAHDRALVVGGRRVDDLIGSRHENLTICHQMTELAGFARGLLRQGN